MALGFGTKKAEEAGITNDSKNPDDLYDPEDQSANGRRRLSRVADDSSSTLSVGKQIELEADNAIKYRTCSWQKVCFLTSAHGVVNSSRPVADLPPMEQS